MAFDLRHLRYLATLAEARNFSRAAEIIGITQPALSRSVAGIEAEIGFAIFDRTPSEIVPTVMGTQFLKDALRLLHQARQIEAEAKALGKGESGTLSFGLGPLLASLILPELLLSLANRFPRLTVRPLAASASEILTALTERKIEMCLFAEGPIFNDSVITRAIGSIKLGLLARAAHPLATKKGLRMHDLLDYPLAAGSYDKGSERGSLPEPTIVCENYHILRDVVLGSDTIWLSSLALSPASDRNSLVQLDLMDFPLTRKSILVGRIANHTASRAGQEAERAIEDLLAQIS